MKQLIIDRFEENLAVLETENKTTITVEKQFLPEGAREGDIVVETKEGYCLNLEQSNLRKQKIKEKMGRLFLN